MHEIRDTNELIEMRKQGPMNHQIETRKEKNREQNKEERGGREREKMRDIFFILLLFALFF